MVRQDKITFIISFFEREEISSGYTEDTALDCLIRTILSQATNDKNRDRAYSRLQKQYANYGQLAEAEQYEIEEVIRPGGLAHQKAARIKSTLRWVKNQFDEYSLNQIKDWETDRIFSELTKLPGIGLKTAAVLLCFAFDRAVFPVDVHVHRILTRIGIVPKTPNPDKTFKAVDPFIPYGRDKFLHLHLIEYGRKICTARNPKCVSCEFSEHCDFFKKKNDWVGN